MDVLAHMRLADPGQNERFVFRADGFNKLRIVLRRSGFGSFLFGGDPQAREQLQQQLTRSNARRQGAWYFDELSDDEVRALETQLATGQARLLSHAALGLGRVYEANRFQKGPHRADVLVEIRESTSGSTPLEGEFFVRGRIRHARHKTLMLSRWCRAALEPIIHSERDRRWSRRSHGDQPRLSRWRFPAAHLVRSRWWLHR